MQRTYLLGAGFSKAVSNGPVLSDLWSFMKQAYEYEKIRNDIPDELRYFNHRVDWFDELTSFIEEIENEATKRFHNLRSEYEIKTKIRENLEYLFTLIDLHINAPNVEFSKLGTHVDPYPFIPLLFTSKRELEEISGIFSTYFYLVFQQLEESELSLKFANLICPKDNILTFNYDLIVEKSLLKLDKWFPLNGYIAVNRFDNGEDEIELTNKGKHSPIKIHKMHGSINWRTKSNFETWNSKDEVLIVMDNLQKQNFYFNDLLSRKPLKTSPEFFVGSYSPKITFPSYVKPLNNHEFFQIWRSAQNVLKKTNELIIIGYSFRAEDSNAFLLLSNLPEESKIIIVDKNFEPIKKKINNFGYQNVVCFDSLQNFLSCHPKTL